MYALNAPGEPRQRLLPGIRDLRTLAAGRTPDRSAPLAVRIPYTTKDGHLALRTWLRTAHAEVASLHITEETMTVNAHLYGAHPGNGATALLRLRGPHRTEHETELRPGAGQGFSVTIAYRDLLKAPPGIWDLSVRPAGDGPRIRLGRLLDDVADRKRIFTYPSVTTARATIRPYYTVHNDLSLEVTDP